MARTCSEGGCSNPTRGRGRCRACWKRECDRRRQATEDRRCTTCSRRICTNNRSGFCNRCRYAQQLPEEGLSVEERGDALYVERVSTVRTLDELLRAAEVDLAVWEVDHWIANAWGKGSNHWQVKAWLRRAVPKKLDKALELLERRIGRHAPRYPKLRRSRHRDPHLLEFSPFDTHFGKLTWAPETGENYDLKIAERVFANALQDTLASVHGYEIEGFLFPVGQDFYHVDGWRPETFAGTPQDTDGRYPRMFEVGAMACIRAIDIMAGIAPVRVVYVRANHDPTTSWHLVKFLDAWYRQCDAVTIDAGPAARKYERYGASLIGLAHGEKLVPSRLPGLMATEAPTLWAATEHHEFHLGHLHKRRALEFVSVDSHEGVVVRVLPSLSGRDAYHYERGYIGVRAAESYLWSRRDGYRGHFSVNARTA